MIGFQRHDEQEPVAKAIVADWFRFSQRAFRSLAFDYQGDFARTHSPAFFNKNNNSNRISHF